MLLAAICAASAAEVAPNNGPFAGGNTVLVTNAAPNIGNGSDITNVVLGSVKATAIVGQGENWVAFVAPTVGSVGAKDIWIQSTSAGNTTLAGAYTVNPQGSISGGAGGKRWQSVGNRNVPGFASAVGANNTIYGMDFYDGVLYAGGSFTNIGGSNCARVARFNGTNWASMGVGVEKVANLNSIRGSPYGVYAGGYFTNIGGTNAMAVGRWDGTNWNAMGRAPTVGYVQRIGLGFSPNVNGYVNWVEPYTGNTAIVVGYFTNTDFRTEGVQYIAKYDGKHMTNMGGGFRNVPLCATRGAGGTAYVGGSFTNHNPAETSRHLNFIAEWTGTSWTNMARGFGNRVTCMKMHPASGEIYIGGWFTNYMDDAGNKHAAKYVAKWNPVTRSFTNLGAGLNNWVYALDIDRDGNVWVAGSFTNCNTGTAQHYGVGRVAMWNGTVWTNVGYGLNDTVLGLAYDATNDAMYAGGFFRLASQGPASTDNTTNAWYVAKWAMGSGGGPGVEPVSGSCLGGYMVTIQGANLGNGSDVTNVTICGVPAASIQSQSATQIVAIAGTSYFAATGDVRVFSTAYGETVKGDVFEYVMDVAPQAWVLGTNLATIASGEAASLIKGGDFGRVAAGDNRAHIFTIENPGVMPLTITGLMTNGAGASAFACSALPASLGPRGSCALTVTFAPVAPGVYTAQVAIAGNQTDSPYRVNLAGAGWQITLSTGPYAGGTSVTLSNGVLGSGADITNVTIGGAAASVTGQGANWVRFTTPAATASGAQDVVVRSATRGASTFAGAFTYGLRQAEPVLLGVNGQAITNNQPTSFTAGTAFGNVSSNLVVTNWFTLYNPGERELYIALWGQDGDALKFPYGDIPFRVSPGCHSNFWIAFTPGSAGNYASRYNFNYSNETALTSFYFHVSGTGVVVSGGGGGSATVASATPGTNGTQSVAPVNIWYRSRHGQMIYTVAELSAAGMSPGTEISQVGFYVTGAPVYALPSYLVRMKHTTASSMTSTLDSSGLVTVYSNQAYSPTAGGFDMMTMQSSFVWNGTNNLLVDWCFNIVEPNYDQSGQCLMDEVANGMAHLQSDTVDQRYLYDSAAVTNQRPQIRFATSGVQPGHLVLLGTNAAAIAPDEPASRAKGSDFGAVAWTATVTNTFSVTNSGGGALGISSWTTNGAGAPAYRVTGLPTNLAAGEKASFNVAFQPQGPGAFPAWISLNNSAQTPFRLNLAGTSLAARISVAGDGDFGGALTGRSLSRSFTIENNGTQPLTISGVTTGGAGAASFRFSGIPASVAAGGSGSFTVTFTPATDGAKTATLTVTGNSPDSPVVLNLSGAGITEPRFALRGINGAAIAKDESATVAKGGDFGIVPRNTPAAHTFTITNAGNASISIGSWTTNGTGSPKFTVAGMPVSVAAGATAPFTVTFLDAEGGLFEAQLRIDHNGDTSPFALNILAQGQLPGMDFLTLPITNATEGLLYEYAPEAQDLQALSANITYTASNLPAWLSFDPPGNGYRIQTLAGNSEASVEVIGGWTNTSYTFGFSGDGGPATNASFFYSSSVAADSLGNVYIADRGNYRIRRVDAGGIVATVAGTGSAIHSGDDGPATNAGFSLAKSVAVGGQDEVYVIDESRIRKIGADGIIRRVAGKGSYGYSGEGGPATNAAIVPGYGLVVDGAGNVYFAALASGARICKVDTNGILRCIAGGATTSMTPGQGEGQPAVGVALCMNSDSGLAVDDMGRVFFAERDRIRYVDSDGILRTRATGLVGVQSLASDRDGVLYATQNSNGLCSRIFTIDPQTNVTLIAGNGTAGLSGDGGMATNASLGSGGGVTMLALGAKGQVYVADERVHRVRVLTLLPARLIGTPLPEHVGSVSTVTVHAVNSRTSADQTFTIAVAGQPRAALVNPLGNIGFSGVGTDAFQSFGSVPTNEVKEFTLAITNSGSATLVISGVSTSGSGAFSICDAPSAIEAGTASNFTVRYAPGALGTEQAVFSIAHTAVNTPLTLTADGYGLKPGEMGVDKVSLSYAATYGGADPVPQTVTLTNKGEVAYRYTNETLGGVAWLVFTPRTNDLAGRNGVALTGTVQIAGLGGGTYIATNRISSGASNSPIDVLVRLDIARAGQTITFGALGETPITTVTGLAATASSGLPVSFKVSDGPAQLAEGTNLSFQNEGYVTMEVTQAGNANYTPAPTITNRFLVTKTSVAITITNASNKTYDGSPVTDIGVETVPADVPCSITYNGGTNAPLNAGLYAIAAQAADWRYVGSGTATMQIFRASRAVTLNNPSFVYDGLGKTAIATTTPEGLTVEVRYNGELAAPVNVGSYTVAAAIVEANYSGETNGTLTITKADQTLSFNNLGEQLASATTNLSATASSGLDPVFEIAEGPAVLLSGVQLSFSNSGSVTLLVKQPGDGNWNPAPTITNIFNVVKLSAPVFFEDTEKVYNGISQSVVAYADPASLSVIVTYDGSTNPPTAAGIYAVTGTVSDAQYVGETNGTFAIAKAEQAISFPDIAPKKVTASVGLAATGGDSGNPVTFAVTDGPGSITDDTNLTFSGVGDVVVVASQEGDDNHDPATDVTNVVKAFSVTPDNGPFAGGNSVTVSNGSFGVITNLLVAGTGVLPVSSGADWFTIVMPALGATGSVGIVVQTADNGDITLAHAYTYNPAGAIYGRSSDWSRWEEMTALPVKRKTGVGGALNGALYYMAGTDGTTRSNVYRFADGIWSEAPSTPRAAIAACGDTYEGSLYFMGAFTAVTNVDRFDGGQWHAMPGLPQPRAYAGSAAYNGKLYVVGGRDAGGVAQSAVYAFTGGAWSAAASLPRAVWGQGVGVLHGRMYSVGGWGTNCVFAFDGVNWTEVAGLPANRSTPVVKALGDYLYCVGGSDGSAGQTNVYRFDGTNWAQVAGLPGGRSVAGGATLDGALYLMAGESALNTLHSNVYRYPATVWTMGVEPASGSWTGGYTVVISGQNLGNGSDITNVTLCGVSATSIESQSATQVVVVGGEASVAGLGNVVVCSTSYGETIKSNAFTYTASSILVFGPDFAPTPLGVVVTNIFTVTNAGSAVLTITAATNSGVGAAYFGVTGLTGLTVDPGTASNFPVVFAPGAIGTFTPACYTANNSPVPNYYFGLHGSVFQLSTNAGPYAGGNTITITNGHFGTITNVLVGGVAASVQASGSDWVTIVMPATGAAGVKDIVIQTDSGDITLANAYTVNPAGSMGGMVIDGFAWTNMAQGFVDTVYAVWASTNGDIYAGGMFTSAVDGASMPRIAKWDGTAWTNVGIGFNNIVREIREDSTGTLYAVGEFNGTFGGNQNCRRIGRWDGENWTNMGLGVSSAGYTVTFDTNDVPYFGGTFTSDGYLRYFGRVAKWDGGNWTNIYESDINDETNPIGFGNTVYTSVRGLDGTLYFGGNFTNAFTPTGSVAMACVAMWDGTELYPMGAGFDGLVYKLVVDSHGTLYAGGNFTASGGQSINRVARWDGVNWTNVGDGANSTVYALSLDAQDNLYASGSFSSPGNRLAMWDGTMWHDAGGVGGINNSVWSLACVSNETMVVGGAFTLAGGVATNRIGQVWPNRVYNSGATPSSGSWTGGYTVAIVGENIGNGNDITNVTLCGIQAAILSQIVDRVWVAAGAAPAAQVGDVVVHSTSYGMTIGSNAFTYTASGILVSGPAFAPVALGGAATNIFTVTNSGNATLTITAATNNGAGAAYFDVTGLTGLTVDPGTASNFPVVFTASHVGTFTPTCYTVNNSPYPNYYFGLYASVFQLSTNVGPYAGGNTITITNGHFGTITNVLVSGVAASVQASGSDWVTIVMPATGAAGVKDIVIQTDSGDVMLANAYTYHPAGWIIDSEVRRDWTRWTEVAGLPQGMRYMDAATQNGKIVMGGGYTSVIVTNVFAFDGTNWAETAGLPAIRRDVAFAVLNGTLYSIGGQTAAGAQANVYAYNGTNWTSVAGLPAARTRLRAGTLNGKMYAVGGSSSTTTGTGMQTNVYAFDGASWSEVAGLPMALETMSVEELNGSLYAVGGNANGVTNVFRFDGTDWTEVVGLPAPRTYMGSAVMDGKIYVVGGMDFQACSNVYTYNGTNWTETAALPGPRRWLAASTLGDHMYAMGGASGTTALTNVFEYPSLATVYGVAPSNGLWIGGYPVVITGTNLGNGADITNVTLCGVAATVVSQTADRVWILAGAASAAGSGDVCVYSVSYGETVKSNAFTYTASGILVSGPAFAPVALGGAATNIFTVTNSGNATLTITAATNGGAGAAYFDVTGLTGLTVDPGTASNFPVVFTAGAIGTFNPACYTVNNSPYPNYYFGLYASVFQLSTNVGPYAGGNTITITNGHFGTITNVLVGGVAASVQASGSDWVTIVVPATGSAGVKSIVIQTDGGDVNLPGVYTVNHPGAIGATVEDWTRWHEVAGLPEARSYLAAGSVNSELYVAGGMRGSHPYQRSNAYHFVGNGWEEVSGMPKELNESGYAVFNGYLCVIGGSTPSGFETNLAYRFDGTAWTSMALLPSPRSGVGVGVLGTNLYVVGGSFSFASQTNVFRFNGTSWDQVSGLPTQRQGLAVAALGTNLYAIGGYGTSYNSFSTNVYRYSGTTWVQVNGLPKPLAYVRAAVLNEHLYTVGGATLSFENCTNVFCFDGTNWTEVAGLPEERSSAGVTVHNGSLFAMGGSAGEDTPQTNVYCYPGITMDGGVQPSSGPVIGGSLVTITGSNLCDGADVTNVTLCGVSVASIESQSATQVVVVAGAAGAAGLGDVRVCSASYGETIKSNAFTYLMPGFRLIGTNAATIVHNNTPSSEDGTDFGTLIVGLGSLTNTFSITNSGNTALAISGVTTSGAGAASYRLVNAPAMVPMNAVVAFDVVFTPNGGQQNAVITFAHDATNSPFALNVTGFGSGGGIALGTNLLVYSGVFQGSDPAAQGVNMRNVGVSGFSYSNTWAYGAGASGWLEVSPVAGSVAFGGEVDLTNAAFLSGVNAGVYYATNRISSVDATNAPQSYVVALVVDKASQTITWPPIGGQLTTNKVGLTATASSGLPVSFSVLSGPADIAGGTNLTFSGAGQVMIQAYQIGNSNWYGAPSLTNTFTVAKAVAQVTLNDLLQTYNGTSRMVTATTVPSGLTVDITYDGSGTAPIDAGSYSVTGVVSDVMYQGLQTGTLVVSKAAQGAITFTPATPQIYLTTNLLSASGGSGTGLFSFEVVSGPGALVSTNALRMTSGTGTVLVRATKAGDDNWNPASVTGSVTAAKADQVVTFPNPGNQLATNVVMLTASASSGLPVAYEVFLGPVVIQNTNQVAFTNKGAVILIALQVGDTNWNPAASNVAFTVVGAPAAVHLTNLAHVYDGGPKSAAATTIPVGLNVVVTYAGLTNWPVNAGEYSLVGLVQEPLYQGGATDVFAIARAPQTITFGVIGDQVITNRIGLAATASSGLTVSFGVTGPAGLAGGTNLSFTGTGTVSVTASQAGNTNWLAASNVVHVFTVYPLRPILSGLFHASAEATTADMGAVIENVYGANATERGILWSTNEGFAVEGATKVPLFGSFGAGGWTQQVAGLVSGITNYYRAYAVNAAGTGYTVEAWVHMKPGAPVADSATSINPDSFLANWAAARGATNYLLDVSEDDEFGTFINGYENRGVGDVQSHTVTGLTAGMLYHYRVRAENQAGVSTNSETISVLTAPRLTILTWPREAGQTIPEQGSYIVDFATPTQVVTWANAGYQFAYWEGAGAILVDDYDARTTTVTLLMNSVLTAYYQQQAGGITWTYTTWKTNYMQGAVVGEAEVCNIHTNGTRLMGPFWYCVESNNQQRLRFPTGVDPVSGWPYVDVTAQIEEGAGDGILDPGECVTVTNIAFYTYTLKPVSNIVWQVRAVEIPAEDRVDTDGDGIPDEFEAEYPPALDPLNPTDGPLDFDKDGMPNDSEWVSGTDPTDERSFLALDEITRPSEVGNLLSWPSVTGRVYGLYWTSNALHGYEMIREGIQATPPANTVTDAIFGVEAQGFYRIDVRNP